MPRTFQTFSFSARALNASPTVEHRHDRLMGDEEVARITATLQGFRRTSTDAIVRRVYGNACVIEVTHFPTSYQGAPAYRVVVLRANYSDGTWGRTLRFRVRDYASLAGVSRRVNRAWSCFEWRDADQSAGAPAHHPAIRRRQNITTGAALRNRSTPRIGQTQVPRGPRCPCCNVPVPTEGAFCQPCTEQGRDARGEL